MHSNLTTTLMTSFKTTALTSEMEDNCVAITYTYTFYPDKVFDLDSVTSQCLFCLSCRLSSPVKSGIFDEMHCNRTCSISFDSYYVACYG